MNRRAHEIVIDWTSFFTSGWSNKEMDGSWPYKDFIEAFNDSIQAVVFGKKLQYLPEVGEILKNSYYTSTWVKSDRNGSIQIKTKELIAFKLIYQHVQGIMILI
jgi:hypothetical protein